MRESHRARTGQNPSMPPRSNHPGLKWRHTASRRQPYWVAKQVVRDPKGFPERTIRLPADVDEDTLAELCRDHTARLLAWLAAPEGDPVVAYDRTIRALSRLYQTNSTPIHLFTTSSATPERHIRTVSR